MPEPLRLIKKYPNRRLYDTRTSVYITLSDVKELVLAALDFQVVDAQSGDDLTRSVLLQILIEEEGAGVPLFSSALLAHMIRFYGHAMQGMLGQYLETAVGSFSELQKTLQEGANSLAGENSGQAPSATSAEFMNAQAAAMQATMASYIEQSRKLLDQLLDQLKNQTPNML